MSSSSQAADLSMDEILASIRKIISEDPKPVSAQPIRSPAPAASASMPRSASQIMSSRQGVDSIVESSPPARSPRTAKPAVDDDILDLGDEERGLSDPLPAASKTAGRSEGATNVPHSPAPLEAKKATEANAAGSRSAATRAPLNDMWTPREWARPVDQSDAVGPSGPAGEATTAAAVAPAGPLGATGEAPEARLEAAIAALGQSLATPTTPAGASSKPSEAPAKPIVVASAPFTPPNAGPRIDVVAVVNAATRAALAQRSADQQTASTAFAPPSEATPASQAATPNAPGGVQKAADAARQDKAITPPREEAAKAPSAVASEASPPPALPRAPVESPMMRTPEAISAPPMSPVSESISTPAEPTGRSELGKAQAPSPTAIAPSQPATTANSAAAPAAQEAPAQPPAGVQTLEDTVARLLRPMLRQWLDDNMPRIVEKAFKEELAAEASLPKTGKLN